MKKMILAIALATITLSCDNSKKIEQTQPETSVDTQTQVAETSVAEEYCFRNEISYDDNPELKEVEDLRFNVKGDSIHGTFEWIPAEKGGLNGKFFGIKKDNVIDAVYDEINSDAPFPIKITLSGDNAELNSSDESFGSFTIKKSVCN